MAGGLKRGLVWPHNPITYFRECPPGGCAGTFLEGDLECHTLPLLQPLHIRNTFYVRCSKYDLPTLLNNFLVFVVLRIPDFLRWSAPNPPITEVTNKNTNGRPDRSPLWKFKRVNNCDLNKCNELNVPTEKKKYSCHLIGGSFPRGHHSSKILYVAVTRCITRIPSFGC